MTNTTTISLGSKLSFKETNQFVKTVAESVESGVDTVYIDMQFCQYLNSIMLSGLIRALKTCEKAKRNLVLKKVNASAMTLFETTNVLNLFSIENEGDFKKEESSLELKLNSDYNGIGYFEISGSLSTLDHCTQFREFYEKHLIDYENCILDCSKLIHLGSSGVTEMFRIRGMLQEKQGMLVILNPTDSVESVWRMMHLETLIPRAETMEEAKAQFNH